MAFANVHDDVLPTSDNTRKLTATHDDAADSEDEMPDLGYASADSEDELPDLGYESDESGCQTESDALTSHADEKTPTFSNNRRLAAAPSVVRVARFPQHPIPDEEDAAPHPRPTAPGVPRPSDIGDLFAGNTAGAETWDEVLDGIRALKEYHKVNPRE